MARPYLAPTARMGQQPGPPALHSMIVEDFLLDFTHVRSGADAAEFEDVINPVDGVVYPGICADIPDLLLENVKARLWQITGCTPAIRFLFLRLSLAGAAVPHQAHTDATMGLYSLMVYLNRPEHCQGGTALVRHVGGLDRNPQTAEEQALWARDTNIAEQWTPYVLCPMATNRAFIFRSDLMHRAEPVGGFGSNSRDGRLVLTAFFD